MLGEKKNNNNNNKQKQTNKRCEGAYKWRKQAHWLVESFFYWNCDWTRAWQAVMSNELSQRTIEQQQQQQKTALSVYILPTALFENYSEERF